MAIDLWLERLFRKEILLEGEVFTLCKSTQAILTTESNVVAVNSPVVVCGDIHGQFRDLMQLFQYGGMLPFTNYIFMGDYVDRGPDSVEVISLLFALKIKYPDRITLLRGNHESRLITRRYGFYAECWEKYNDPNIWIYFTQTFDFLPLSAVIDGKIFCLHGGLSPDIVYLDDIRTLDRMVEPPDEGPITDLLWSDPWSRVGWKDSSRGAGYLFGPDVTSKFNHLNQLDFIARGHQVAQNGYYWSHQQEVVTIFSASNYGDKPEEKEKDENRGAIMELDEDRHPTFHCYDRFDYFPSDPNYYLEESILRSCD